MSDIPAQERSAFRRWRNHLIWRFNRRVHDLLYPLISFIHRTWFSVEKQPFDKWYAGGREFCWSFLCGDSIGRAIHIANIYWGIGK